MVWSFRKSLAETISVEIDSMEKITTIQNGAFIRDSQKAFLSVSVSDVQLNGANIVRQARIGDANYALVEIGTADLLTQLQQEITGLSLQLREVLGKSSGEDFNSWWTLRKQLAVVKVVARNLDVLEKFGAQRIADVDVLIEHYFKRLYASYNARQLTINIDADFERADQLRAILEQQLSTHTIDVTTNTLYRNNSGLIVTAEFDHWSVGHEHRATGRMIVELKADSGQTLASMKLDAFVTSIHDALDAKIMTENRLLQQLQQTDVIETLVKKGESL